MNNGSFVEAPKNLICLAGAEVGYTHISKQKSPVSIAGCVKLK
jgi:hypothetical protein